MSPKPKGTTIALGDGAAGGLASEVTVPAAADAPGDERRRGSARGLKQQFVGGAHCDRRRLLKRVAAEPRHQVLRFLAHGGARRALRLDIQIRDPFRLFAARLGVLMRKHDERKAAGAALADIVAAAPQKLAERRLRFGMLLLGGGRQPVDGEPDILLDAVAVEIEAGELILGVGVAEIARRMAEKIGAHGPGRPAPAPKECR